jgi:hypothetical protein
MKKSKNRDKSHKSKRNKAKAKQARKSKQTKQKYNVPVKGRCDAHARSVARVS